MKIRPLHDRVVVRRIEEDSMSAGGIVIPDTAAEKPMTGEVLSVGNGKVQDNGEVRALDVKAGDKVLFGKYSGTEVKVEGDDVLVMREDDIMGVIEGCADRAETWISDKIAGLYEELHDAGFAHSVEVRDETGLIGGVYGVALGGAFFGESMFSRRTDASKIALAWLVAHLGNGGFRLFDTQFLTSHLASLGGIEVSRAEYRSLLAEALAYPADFTTPALPRSGHEVVQFNTQMS